MAAQVKLVRRRDFGPNISLLSLLGYDDGFQLPREGWIQAVASGDAEVAEAMTLYVQASSHDDLASKLQSLDDKIREVDWHENGVERYGVWLRTQLTDETLVRQALVTGMRCEPRVSFYGPLVAPGNFVRGYNLALERTPWWEATGHITYNSAGLNCLGGTYSYTTYDGSPGAVVGNKPARIAHTSFNGASGGGGPLYEFWMGFRTDRFGDRANFVPVWDMGQSSDSTPSNDTTSSTDDSPYGGYKWTCSFGDESELVRVTKALLSVTSDYGDQRGEFVVLLRAKVGADTVCHVRLKDGFIYTAAMRAQQRVKVDSTSWRLYVLGTINIPPSRGIVTANFLRQYGFALHASRASGTNNLDMDCFILIPRAEGFVHVSGGGVQYAVGDTKPIAIRMHPNGEIDGWWYTSGMPWASVVIEPDGYALPVGDGSLILAGQHEAEHVLADYVNITMQAYCRWRTLRGAE